MTELSHEAEIFEEIFFPEKQTSDNNLKKT